MFDTIINLATVTRANQNIHRLNCVLRFITRNLMPYNISMSANTHINHPKYSHWPIISRDFDAASASYTEHFEHNITCCKRFLWFGWISMLLLLLLFLSFILFATACHCSVLEPAKQKKKTE